MDASKKRYSQFTIRQAMLCGLALTVLLPGRAQGYSLRKGEDGVLLLWRAARVQVQVDASALPGLSGPQVIDHVQAAFLTWTANGVPAQSTFKQSTGQGAAAKDGRNMVQWVSSGWRHGKEAVAITISWYRASTGEVLESDIQANAEDYRWGVTPAKGSGLFDVQNIMAHEAGHFWGVGHSDVQGATMWEVSQPGQLSKRTLAQDDRDGIVALVTALGTTDAAPAQLAQNQAVRSGHGCSAAGDTREGGVALLVLICLLLRARHGRGVMALLPVALMLWAAPAGADDRLEPTATRLAAAAPLVFQGVVTGGKSHFKDGLIVTDSTISVQRCFKGPCPTTRTLRTLGGVVGDLGMHVAGEARPRPGQELILFGRLSQGVVRTLGLAAGVYQVTRDGGVLPGANAASEAAPPGTKRSRPRLEQFVHQIQRGAANAVSLGASEKAGETKSPSTEGSDTSEKREKR